jgi:hypothetical protein
MERIKNKKAEVFFEADFRPFSAQKLRNGSMV